MTEKTKKIALNGILISLALVLGYVESLMPAFFIIPGIKLGITNVVVLYALYQMGKANALFLNIIRILIVGMICGNAVGLIYSLAGGVLSYIVMLILKEQVHLKIVTVSIAGGIAHNFGQILAAIFLTGTSAIAWYFALLWLTGIVSGAIIGIICAMIINRICHISFI